MNSSLKISVAGESLWSQFLSLSMRQMLIISLNQSVNNLQLQKKKKADFGLTNSGDVCNSISWSRLQDYDSHYMWTTASHGSGWSLEWPHFFLFLNHSSKSWFWEATPSSHSFCYFRLCWAPILPPPHSTPPWQSSMKNTSLPEFQFRECLSCPEVLHKVHRQISTFSSIIYR